MFSRNRFLKCVWVRTLNSILSLSLFFSSVPASMAQGDSSVAVVPPGENLAVPSAFFDTIHIPENLGKIRECYVPENIFPDKAVILIQDAHCNVSAHQNIRALLNLLVKEQGISFIGVEGAKGLIDYDPFYVGTKDQRDSFCNEYMQKGMITGLENFALVEGENLSFSVYGLEERIPYYQNFIALRDTFEERQRASSYLDSLNAFTDDLKGRIYSPSLKEIDQKHSDFLSGKLNQSEYILYLSGLLDSKPYQTEELKSLFRDEQSYPNFKKLRECIVLEKAIDFSKMENEQNLILKTASASLQGEELKKLNEMNEKFSTKSVNSSVYYPFLGEYIRNLGLDSSCPNILQFIKLRRMFDEVKTENVREEVRDIAFSLQLFSCENEDQKMLVRITRYLYVLSRLVDLRLTRDQMAYYITNEDGFSLGGTLEWLRTKSDENTLSWPKKLDGSQFAIFYAITSATDYYENLLLRDRIMVENLLNAQDQRGETKSILIAGGFHTEGMARLLKDQGIPYLIITPRVGKPTDTYYEVMMNLSPEMNSLFESENSGLAPPLMLGNGLDIKAYLSIREIYAKIFNTDDPKVLDKLMQEKLKGDKQLLPQQKKDLIKILEAQAKRNPKNAKFQKALKTIRETSRVDKAEKELSVKDVGEAQVLVAKNSAKIRVMEYLKSKLKRFSQKELDAELERIDQEGGTGKVRLTQLIHPYYGVLTKDTEMFHALMDANKYSVLKTALDNANDEKSVKLQKIIAETAIKSLFKSPSDEAVRLLMKDMTPGEITEVLKIIQSKQIPQDLAALEAKLPGLREKLAAVTHFEDLLPTNSVVNAALMDFIMENHKQLNTEEMTAKLDFKNQTKNLTNPQEIQQKREILNAALVKIRAKEADLMKLVIMDSPGPLSSVQKAAYDKAREYQKAVRNHNFYQFEMTREYKDTLAGEKERRVEFLSGIYHAFYGDDTSRAPFLDYSEIKKVLDQEMEARNQAIAVKTAQLRQDKNDQTYTPTQEDLAGIPELKYKAALTKYLSAEKDRIRQQTTGATREEAERQLLNNKELMSQALSLVNASISIGLGYPFMKDMQLIACMGAFSGRNVLELATGEGKTEVSIATAFLNSLAHDANGKGFGSVIVTTKDNSAIDTHRRAKLPFELLGMTVGVVKSTENAKDSQSVSSENKEAYECEVTVVSTTQFHFNVLEDRFMVTQDDKKNIKRDLTQMALIIDEFDSVMIHQARTEYIMSGSSSLTTKKTDKKYFDEDFSGNSKVTFDLFKAEMKTAVDQIKQRNLSPEIKDYLENEILKKLNNGSYTTEQMKYVLAYVACLKEGKFDKDFDLKSVSTDTQSKLASFNRSTVFKTQDALAGLAGKLFSSEQEWQSYLKEQMDAKLKFTKDVDYGVDPVSQEVKLIDSKTGALQNSVRLQASVKGGGGHIALELLNNVPIKEDTMTTASLTSRDIMAKGQIGKISGMTGTAKQTNKSQAALYGVEYMPLPTSTPVLRKDIGIDGLESDDLPQKLPVFDSEAELFDYMTQSIIKDVKSGRPMLAFTSNDQQGEYVNQQIFNRLKKLLNDPATEKVDGMSVLEIFRSAGRLEGQEGSFTPVLSQYFASHAQSIELETQIVEQDAGKPGAVTVVTNIGGRGTDFKPSKSVQSQGFHTFGVRYIEGDDLEMQRRGRSGRAGAPGLTEEMICREDFEKIRKIEGVTEGLNEKEKALLDDWINNKASVKNNPQLARIAWKVVKKAQQLEVERLGEQIERDTPFCKFKFEQQTAFKAQKKQMYEDVVQKQIIDKRISGQREIPQKISDFARANLGNPGLNELIQKTFGISMEGVNLKNTKTEDGQAELILFLTMSLSKMHWENSLSEIQGKWFRDILKVRQDITDEKQLMKTLDKDYSLSKLLQSALQEKFLDNDADFFSFVDLQMRKMQEKQAETVQEEKTGPQSVYLKLMDMDKRFDSVLSGDSRFSSAEKKFFLQYAASHLISLRETLEKFQGNLNDSQLADLRKLWPLDIKGSALQVYEHEIAEKTVFLHSFSDKVSKALKISETDMNAKFKPVSSSADTAGDSKQRMVQTAVLSAGVDQESLTKALEQKNLQAQERNIATKTRNIQYSFNFKTTATRTEKTRTEVKKSETREEKKGKELFTLLNSKDTLDEDAYKAVVKLLSTGDKKAINEAFVQQQIGQGVEMDIETFLKVKFSRATDQTLQFRLDYTLALLNDKLTDELMMREMLGQGGLEYEKSALLSSVLEMDPERAVSLLMDDRITSKSEVLKDAKFFNELKSMAFSKLWTTVQAQALQQNKQPMELFQVYLKRYTQTLATIEDQNVSQDVLFRYMEEISGTINEWKKNATSSEMAELTEMEAKIAQLSNLAQRNMTANPEQTRATLRDEINRLLLDKIYMFEHLKRLQEGTHAVFTGATLQDKMNDAALFSILKISRSGVKDALSFKGRLYSVFSDSEVMNQYVEFLKNNKESAQSALNVLNDPNSAVSKYLNAKSETTLKQWLDYKTKAVLAQTDAEREMNEAMAYIYEKKKNPVSAWFNKTFVADKGNAVGLADFLSKMENPSEAIMRQAMAQNIISPAEFQGWMTGGQKMQNDAAFDKTQKWFTKELQKAGIDFMYIQPLLECPKGGVALLEIKSFIRNSDKGYRLDYGAPFDINAKRLISDVSKLSPEGLAYLRRNTYDLMKMEIIAGNTHFKGTWFLIKDMLGIDRNESIENYTSRNNFALDVNMQISQQEQKAEMDNFVRNFMTSPEYLAARVRYERRGLFMQMYIEKAEWLDTKIPLFKYNRKEVVKLIAEAQKAAKERAEQSPIDKQTAYKNYMSQFAKLCLGDATIADADLPGLLSKVYKSSVKDYFLGNKELTLDVLLKMAKGTTKSAMDIKFSEYALKQASFDDLFNSQDIQSLADQIQLQANQASAVDLRKQIIEQLTEIKPELKTLLESKYTKKDQLVLKEAAYEQMKAVLQGMDQNAQFNSILNKAGLRSQDLQAIIDAQYLQIRQSRIQNIKLPDKIWIQNAVSRRQHSNALNQRIGELKDALSHANDMNRINTLVTQINQINVAFRQEQTEYFQYLEKIATRTKSIFSMVMTVMHMVLDILCVALLMTGVFSWAGVLLFAVGFTGLSAIQALFNFTIDRIFLSWKVNTATSVFSLLTSILQVTIKVGMDALFSFLKIITLGAASIVSTLLTVSKFVLNFVINKIIQKILHKFLPKATNQMFNSNFNMLGMAFFDNTKILESIASKIKTRLLKDIKTIIQDIYKTVKPVSDSVNKRQQQQVQQQQVQQQQVQQQQVQQQQVQQQQVQQQQVQQQQVQQQQVQQQQVQQQQVQQQQVQQQVIDFNDVIDIAALFEEVTDQVRGGGSIGVSNEAVIKRLDPDTVEFASSSRREWTATAKTKTMNTLMQETGEAVVRINRETRLREARAQVKKKFQSLLKDKSTSKLCRELNLTEEKLLIAFDNIDKRLFAFAKTANQEGKFVLGAGIGEEGRPEGEIGFDESFLLKMLDSENKDLITIALFHEAMESVTPTNTHDKIREIQKVIFGDQDLKLTNFIRSFNLARSIYPETSQGNIEKQKELQLALYTIMSKKKAGDSYETIIKLLTEGECNMESLMSVIELLEKSNDKKKLGEFKYSKELVQNLLAVMQQKDKTFSAFGLVKTTFQKMGMKEYEIREIEKQMKSLFNDLDVKDGIVKLSGEQQAFLALLGKRILSSDKDQAKIQASKLANSLLVSLANNRKILLGQNLKVISDALVQGDPDLDLLPGDSKNFGIVKLLSQQNMMLEKVNEFMDSDASEFAFNKNASLIKKGGILQLQLKTGDKVSTFTDDQLQARTGFTIRGYTAFYGACALDTEAFQAGLGIRQSVDTLFDKTEKVFADAKRQTVIDVRGLTEDAELREVAAFVKKVIKGHGQDNNKIMGMDENFITTMERMGIRREDLAALRIAQITGFRNDQFPLMVITRNMAEFNKNKGCLVLDSSKSLQASMVGALSFISRNTEPLTKLKDSVDSKENGEIEKLLKIIADDKKILTLKTSQEFAMPVMKPILDSILSQLADEEETVLIAG